VHFSLFIINSTLLNPILMIITILRHYYYYLSCFFFIQLFQNLIESRHLIKNNFLKIIQMNDVTYRFMNLFFLMAKVNFALSFNLKIENIFFIWIF